jgi:hypothetical protein
MDTPNSMNMCNTSSLTELQSFLKSMNILRTVSLKSHFSPVSDEYKISDQ